MRNVNSCQCWLWNFSNNLTIRRSCKVIYLKWIINMTSYLITHCHLTDSRKHSMSAKCISCKNISFLNQLMNSVITLLKHIELWKLILIFFYYKFYNFIIFIFKLWSNNISFLSHIYSKWNKCWWNINIVKGSRHRVLSTYRWKTQLHLSFICSKKSSYRLAPTFWILAHSSKIFLEWETNLLIITASCNNLWYRLYNCIDCSMIRTPFWKIWIKTIAHHCNCIRLSTSSWKLSNHTLCLCHLLSSTIRHKNCSRTNGAVKHFYKTLLWTLV